MLLAASEATDAVPIIKSLILLDALTLAEEQSTQVEKLHDIAKQKTALRVLIPYLDQESIGSQLKSWYISIRKALPGGKQWYQEKQEAAITAAQNVAGLNDDTTLITRSLSSTEDNSNTRQHQNHNNLKLFTHNDNTAKPPEPKKPDTSPTGPPTL